MKYEIPSGAIIESIDSEYRHIENNCSGLFYDGLLVITTKGNIKLLIDADQYCCEQWGREYLETPDDISKLIGATLLSVEDIHIPSPRDSDDEAKETQLRITTNRGVIQYAVYNSHNGYYSHTTFLQVFDELDKGSL
jgi:hypothetical protein